MTVIDSFPQPFHDQNTQQPSSSLVGNFENCLVSNAMSLVYVVVMYCMYFIGWKSISFYVLCFTTHCSNLKSLDPPSSLNYECDLVSHSSLSMDPFTHGDTITLIFYAVYDIDSDI